MLLTLFPSLKSNKVLDFLQKLYSSKYYMLLIGITIFLCHAFSFEIIYFYSVVFVAVVIPFLFCEDLLAVVPPLAMTYSSISLKSNNTKYKTSIIGGENKIHLLILVTLIITLLLVRLIFDICLKKNRRFSPYLLVGYLILGFAYIFGGFLTSFWNKDTITYGLVCFASISACYFLLLYLVEWKNVKKEYYAWLITIYGLVVSAEVFYLFFKVKSGDTSYISWHDQLYTGWGMRNNIAGQIALCAVGPIFLSLCSKKLSFIYLIPVPLMLLAVLLTNSRGGAAVLILLIFAGFIIYFKKCDKRQMVQAIIFIGVTILAATIIIIIKRKDFIIVFSRFFDNDSSSGNVSELVSTRDITWVYGLGQFIEKPLFGVGFYQCDIYRFENFSTNFVPARYHNIYIQFLASTGFVGLTAYIFHRIQTVRLVFKELTLEKAFIFMSILGIVLCSMVDNNFFNLGPGINYSIGLAFIEGANSKNLNLNLKFDQQKRDL